MKEMLLQEGGLKSVRGMDLKSVAPWFSREIRSQFLAQGELSLADQVDKLWIELQIVHGSKDEMTFSIFPLPAPSVAELKKIWPPENERMLTITVNNGKAIFCTNVFGRIERIYVSNVPGLYDALAQYFKFNDRKMESWTPIEH